jgi:hypothetical protein
MKHARVSVFGGTTPIPEVVVGRVSISRVAGPARPAWPAGRHRSGHKNLTRLGRRAAVVRPRHRRAVGASARTTPLNVRKSLDLLISFPRPIGEIKGMHVCTVENRQVVEIKSQSINYLKVARGSHLLGSVKVGRLCDVAGLL